MPYRTATPKAVSIHISRSHASTTANKTGTWRFLRPRYQEKTAPCSVACPAGEDIGRVEMLAARRLFSLAGQTVLMENPFPAVCGRVCFHPCEAVCNRVGLDEAVAIHHVERLVGDYLLERGTHGVMDRLDSAGRRVAVVGAGPAGLSAAYFLNRLGYDCDVFEAAEAPGGLLRWGIPAYRLPGGVLAREIARIEAIGVPIRCGVRLPADFLSTAKERYDGVFIGCGNGRRVSVNFEGETGAIDGLDLLRRVRGGQRPTVDGPVAVIGGGNTAIDVARTLVRLGAEPIVCYRRRRQDMPAFAREVDSALEEGVRIRDLVMPVRLQHASAQAGAERMPWRLVLQRTKPVGHAPDGRARVLPAEGEEESLSLRQVVVAVGADTEPEWAAVAGGSGEALQLSHCALRFHPLPTAFGGDVTNRIKSVADAVASGKQAALALDAYWRHGRDAVEKCLAGCRVGDGPALSMEVYLGGERRRRSAQVIAYDDINSDYFESRPRAQPAIMPASLRRGSFVPPEASLAPDAGASEAARCFNCGLCNACDNCRIFCPEVAVGVKGAQRWIDLDYCKGCGICVAECPRRAMLMEEEVP